MSSNTSGSLKRSLGFWLLLLYGVGNILGAFLAFYAFIGFEDMLNVAEEVREPEINMPRAILWALIITTLLYAMVSLVAMVNLSPQQLAVSEAPLADVTVPQQAGNLW